MGLHLSKSPSAHTIWLDNLAKGETMEWRLAEAKNRFSELVTRALAEGPQRVRRRKDIVVVVAERDFDRLTGKRPDFKRFLMAPGPSLEGVDLTRERSPMREVKV